MKTYPVAFALFFALASFSYSQKVRVLTHAELDKEFQQTQARFRKQVLEDLKKAGVPDPSSDAGRPLLNDVRGIVQKIEPSLPPGRVIDQRAEGSDEGPWAHRLISEQIETPVSETGTSRVLRVTTVFIKLFRSRAAAVDEVAYILARTEAVLSPGSPSLRPIGQASYFSAGYPSTVILFLRDNAVVEVGYSGPFGIPKYHKRGAKPSPGSHPDLSGPSPTVANTRDCEDLALTIDAELTRALGLAAQ